MAKYKIVSYSLNQIDEYRLKIIKKTKYRVFKKILWWWKEIKNTELMCYEKRKSEVRFDTLEAAEEFIQLYHQIRKRSEKVEIVTEKIIELC